MNSGIDIVIGGNVFMRADSDLPFTEWIGGSESYESILDMPLPALGIGKLLLHHEKCFLPDGNGLPRLFVFIDAQYQTRTKIQKILLKKLNTQESGEFPTAENWTSEMRKMVSDIAGVTSRRFDYEIIS